MTVPVHIDQLLAKQQTISVEIMPPKSRAAEANLDALLQVFHYTQPSFVSVTYGAGGSTRERTAMLVNQLLAMESCTPMAHLTCIAHTKHDIEVILNEYRMAGLVNVLALLGDPPANEPEFESPKDFSSAIDLVRSAKAIGDFSLGVAMHPEGHPAARSQQQDRDHQAEKLAEADFGITQFFFDVGTYFSFIDDLHARGVHKPVIPGVVAPISTEQLSRLSSLSGASIPSWVADRLQVSEEEDAWKIGVAIATELVESLLANGAPGVHLYTMNNVAMTRELLRDVAMIQKGHYV